MKILTAQQMREMDRLTVEKCGIPYPILMETAGSRVVEAIIENYGPVDGKLFWVFCGKGNNGGDGAVIARLLWMRGARVRLKLFGALDQAQGEARINLESAKQIAINASRMVFDVVGRTSGEGDSFHRPMTEDTKQRLYSRPDFIVDAIFGTGLTRPAEGKLAAAISDINGYRERYDLRIISVDIPSGLPSDSGRSIGEHVKADLTVTFTAPKIGNVDAPACQANGRLVVAAIGTPGWMLEEESGSHLELVEERQVADWLKASRRKPDAHKGSVGDVLLIAGSRGKTGAAALASETLIRAGTGLVTVATAKSAQPLLITQAGIEIMTEALDELDSGAISHVAIGRALQLAGNRTVVALGPGLSSADESTRRFVRELVEKRTAPMVIDADGLNALAPWPEDLKGSEDLPIIITPHPGEMAKLTGKTNAEVLADRVGVARDFAEKFHLVVVLKGSRTVIAGPYRIDHDGPVFFGVYINPTGNAGMATAGSGDVLTGLIAGLLAQHPHSSGAIPVSAAPRDAAIAGVYLHGLAGDIAAERLGQRSLIASDIIESLGEAILCVGGDRERGRPNSIVTI